MNKLYVVGIGPGDPDQLTEGARRALDDCEVVAGYGPYVERIRRLCPGRTYIVTPMRAERERCRLAVESALSGRTTAIVSSGDPGVYGMAGLAIETAAAADIEITVIPGVTAALAGAAALGAPLGHDFAVISLSDLLTPWEQILRRLRCAAQGDFCIALYNPASHRRKEHLRRACEELLRWRAPETVCATARRIGDAEASYRILSLRELMEVPADMDTTIFIGSSQTRVVGGRMVTPRGYQNG